MRPTPGQPGGLPPGHRQHVAIRVPGRRHLRPFVPGGPAAAAPKSMTRRSRCLVDGDQLVPLTPASTSYGLLPDVGFHGQAGMHTIQFVGLNPQGGDNTAFVDAVTITPIPTRSATAVSRQPALAAEYLPVFAQRFALAVTGRAGVSSNGSALTSGNPNAPGGNQVAFMQDTGSISQSVYLDDRLRTTSRCRPPSGRSQTHYQEIQVLVDGAKWGGHSHRHQLRPLPDAHLQGRRRQAHYPVDGLNPLGWRQYGLDRRGGDHAGRHDQRRQLRVAGTAGQYFSVVARGSPWQFPVRPA